MYKTRGVSVKDAKKKFDYDNDLFVLNHTRVVTQPDMILIPKDGKVYPKVANPRETVRF